MLRFVSLVLALSLLVSPYMTVAVAAPAGAAVRGDPAVFAEWDAAQKKFQAARSWRSKRTIAGQAFTQFTEYVAPDRMRIIHAVDAQGRPLSGSVNIGNDWWNFGGGQCAKSPGRPPQIQRDDRQAAQPPEGYTAEITKGGVETIDGTVTQLYTLAFSGSGLSGTIKQYVARDTGYIRRNETATGQFTIIIDYFDYDTAITIAPPC